MPVLEPDSVPERIVPPLIAEELKTGQVRQANNQLSVGRRVPVDGDVTPAFDQFPPEAGREYRGGMIAKPRHSVHQTQWAAQFAVASELCKQGYEVALTMGNHPSVDLMVIGPKRSKFGIDVKGLYKRNWWTVSPKAPNEGLYYVFAFVPQGSPNKFFILSQEEVNAAIADESSAARLRAEAKGNVSKFDQFPGVSWNAAAAHEDKWCKLPDWPSH